MLRRPAWIALASAGAILAGAAATAAQGPRPAPPPCDPASPQAFTLVAPGSLPVRYDSGFYLEAAGPGYPSGPYLDTGSDAGPFGVTVAPAGPGPLAHAYADAERGLDDRWPLRFEPGDGPARITITYTENHPRPDGSGYADPCTRQLSATVEPTAVEDPHIRLAPSRSRRHLVDRPADAHWAVTVRVRGRISRAARRPVRLDVYEGNVLKVLYTVHPRRGRIAATIHFASAYMSSPVHVRATYPAGVDETWPCDDVLSSGPYDGCHERFRAPRYAARAHD